MADTLPPPEAEGGALLWSADGSLTIRRTPSGFHIVAMSNGVHAVFDARQDDMQAFLEQLSPMVRRY